MTFADQPLSAAATALALSVRAQRLAHLRDHLTDVYARTVSWRAKASSCAVRRAAREEAAATCPTSPSATVVADKFESTFGSDATPLASAIAATVAWYRDRNGTSATPHRSAAS